MALPETKRISLTSSHRLGLTNEEEYSLVDFDRAVYVDSKPIVVDENNVKYYPKVGENVTFPTYPTPFGYIMGIHSIRKFIYIYCNELFSSALLLPSAKSHYVTVDNF